MMAEGSVVTFYSYKGGVGRTLALANIGALLTRWGYKVLCIDWDLEAPGLPLYFERWIQPPTSDIQPKAGLTELISDYVKGRNPRWQEFLTEVRFPEINQPLMLMTAGRQDQDYVQRMQALDWKRLYEEHQFGSFLETMRSEWKEAFDFILIDSRTGITDIGGICTVQLPDLLVLLFTANWQSLRGSLDVVNRAKQTRNSLPFDRSKLLVLPVATRFEARIEYVLAQQWLKTFASELRPLYAEWAHKDVSAEEVLNYTRVPYIPFWSFGEKLPVIERGTSDPEDLGFPLETLAALVAQKFSYSDVLVSNRDTYVMAAQKEKTAAFATKKQDLSRLTVKLFISYSHSERAVAAELEKHLSVFWHRSAISKQNVEQMEAQNVSDLWEADVILLLISASYLASDFIHGAYMKPVFDENFAGRSLVIPILVKPTLWEATPLSKFQILPSNGKPISSWSNQDEAFVNVVQGIREAAVRVKSVRPV